MGVVALLLRPVTAARKVRWLPLALTVLAYPVVAAGWVTEACVISARWCRAAFALGREAARRAR